MSPVLSIKLTRRESYFVLLHLTLPHIHCWLLPIQVDEFLQFLIEAVSSWVKFCTFVPGLVRILIPIRGLEAMSQLSQLQTLKDFYFRKCRFHHKGKVIGYTSAGKGASRWFIISEFSALSVIAHFLSMSQHLFHSLPVPLVGWIEHLIGTAVLTIMIRSWAAFSYKTWTLKDVFLSSTCVLCWAVTRLGFSFPSCCMFQDFRS